MAKKTAPKKLYIDAEMGGSYRDDWMILDPADKDFKGEVGEVLADIADENATFCIYELVGTVKLERGVTVVETRTNNKEKK